MKYTRQAVFNKMTKHLLTQKVKSSTYDKDYKEYTCLMYDSETGRRCVIGSLAPLSSYRKGKLDPRASLEEVFHHLGQKEFYNENITFLRTVQNIHDTCRPSRWAQKLRGFAKRNNLEIPEFLVKA